MRGRRTRRSRPRESAGPAGVRRCGRGAGLRRLGRLAPAAVACADAGAGELDVAAAGGARQQHALQGGGAQDAALQVGEDDRKIEGAEARCDGGEAWRGGAAVNGGREVAAVAQQDADDAQESGDALGHGGGGLIRWRIWRGGRTGGGGRVTWHDSISNRSWWLVSMDLFPGGPGGAVARRICIAAAGSKPARAHSASRSGGAIFASGRFGWWNEPASREGAARRRWCERVDTAAVSERSS